LLAHGRWFSPGTSASSTAKTDRHDIAEILLKVAFRHNQIKSNQIMNYKIEVIFSEIVINLISCKIPKTKEYICVMGYNLGQIYIFRILGQLLSDYIYVQLIYCHQ
jgi:hypothetical protein